MAYAALISALALSGFLQPVTAFHRLRADATTVVGHYPLIGVLAAGRSANQG